LQYHLVSEQHRRLIVDDQNRVLASHFNGAQCADLSLKSMPLFTMKGRHSNLACSNVEVTLAKWRVQSAEKSKLSQEFIYLKSEEKSWLRRLVLGLELGG